MKILKFFLMAFIAISFFACETGSGPGKPGEDTTSTVTPKVLSFSLTYEGQEIKDGDVLDVTMEHYEWGELVAHVFLKNNAAEAKEFTVKEVRNYDYVMYQPSFCVNLCMQGNGEKEQLWKVGDSALEPNAEQELAMHLKVSGFEEVDGEYVDYVRETATCPGVFTVSNGEESLTFTLNFVYVKEEIPAE